MSKGSFRRALLEVDRELATLPLRGERDVRALAGRRRRIAWHVPVLAIAAAIAVLLFMRAREPEPTQVAGFTIDAPESSWQHDGDTVEVLAQKLELDVAGFGHVVASRGARVTRIDGGIRVVRGHVDVSAAHRPTGAAPALVRVSHGTIAVLGTRFTIEQSEHGGSVVLHEGKIRFDSGERSVIITPGSSLSWPLPQLASAAPPAHAPAAQSVVPAAQSVVPAAQSVPPAAVAAPAKSHADLTPPATTPPAADTSTPPAADTSMRPAADTSTPPAADTSTPKPTAAAQLDIDRVLANLANLRARRRFGEAAAMLEQALTAQLPSATLERLSYELGDIRTHQLADPARACRHWQAHRARFPEGRYTVEVAAAVRRLGCKETTP